MTECHRARLASVLAADAQFNARSGLSAILNRDADQAADSDGVQGLKRVIRKNATFYVRRKEAPGIVAAESVGRLGQVVGSEAEEFGPFGNFARGERSPWELYHSPNKVRNGFPHDTQNLLGGMFED